jgi:integrase
VTNKKNAEATDVKTSIKTSTKRFLATYNPTKSKTEMIKSEQWDRVRDFVIEAATPLCFMAINTVRPHLTALVKLAVWADNQGLPLNVSYLLGEAVLSAYEVTEETGVASSMSLLGRVSEANSVSSARRGTPRPDYQAPYSPDEIEALVRFARSHTNQNRRGVLLAIISLGAGAGVVRSRLRGVRISDIHTHDDGRTFIRTTTNCALVRSEFVDVLNEVALLRGSNPLVGDDTSEDLTKSATSWVEGRRGIPALHIDRLRSTYVCTLMTEGASLLDLVAWTGVQAFESLQGYWDHVVKSASHCQGEAAAQ